MLQTQHPNPHPRQTQITVGPNPLTPPPRENFLWIRLWAILIIHALTNTILNKISWNFPKIHSVTCLIYNLNLHAGGKMTTIAIFF